jgi:hypothetical protein
MSITAIVSELSLSPLPSPPIERIVPHTINVIIRNTAASEPVMIPM